MRKMKALVYKQPGRANGSIEEVPYPICGDEQIIIKVISCGICKPAESSHDKNGSVLGKYPATPGHEFSGIIEEVGSKVSNFKVGERVTADNGVPCGKCYYCQNNQPAFCTSFGSMGHNLPGAMAQYIAVPEKNVYRIPDHVSFDEACLSELVACSSRAVERSCVQYGDKVMIMGAGASGMILAQLFKHSNAEEVVILDSEPSKLAAIEKKGVNTYIVDRTNYNHILAQLQNDYPLGFDIIVDATGCAELIETMLNCLKKGGRFVGYSFPWGEKRTVAIDMAKFIINEWTYIGSSFKYTFQKCIDAIAKHKIETDCIITDHFSLSQYFEALDKNLEDSNSIKIIIHPNEE